MVHAEMAMNALAVGLGQLAPIRTLWADKRSHAQRGSI
jgi:hypothetical protein